MFVKRDPEGVILDVSVEPLPGYQAGGQGESDELQSWLEKRRALDSLQSLQHSDRDLVRVIEDLVDVLLQRGVIRITDLPEAAINKLNSRSQARAHLAGLSNLIDQEERDNLV